MLNETYSGFVDFSGTASLSSIVYRIDANGPTTTIRNVGARQVEDNLEVPNILSSALTDLSTKVSSVHSDLDVSLPFQYDIHRLVPIVLQEELSGELLLMRKYSMVLRLVVQLVGLINQL